MFRYALFAHALGLPKSEEPTDPDFHVPRTNTGVGDFPGGDVMVTLGAFSDTDGLPVGTPFMQASTLMHELGHNMERRHGGEAFEPNCKPTYLSVMNYLYQLRGLLDNDGKPHLDFSVIMSAGILTKRSCQTRRPFPVGGRALSRYRIGWYAPLVGSYLDGFGTPARHCARDTADGSDGFATDVPMVRIDARTAAGAIDWNANGTIRRIAPSLWTSTSTAASDASLNGSDDWSNILLNQIGARRNTGGLFVVDSDGDLLVGPLSLDSGRGDLGGVISGAAISGRPGPRRPGPRGPGPWGPRPWGPGPWRPGPRRPRPRRPGPRRPRPRRPGPRGPRRRGPVRGRPGQPRRRTGLRDGDRTGEDAAERVHGDVIATSDASEPGWKAPNIGGVTTTRLSRAGRHARAGQTWTAVGTRCPPSQASLPTPWSMAPSSRTGRLHLLRGRDVCGRDPERPVQSRDDHCRQRAACG